MDIQVKSPYECSLTELDNFERLVLEGDEVVAGGLRQRIEQAERLIFILEKECVAVGAIKNPNESYKSVVFAKAGVSEKSKDYTYELGWLNVTKHARGKGLGRRLMKAVTESLGNASCYATTRENNDKMHYLLPHYSFHKLGKTYQSDKGYGLVLYTNRP
ncbi:MAG: GNAT family N-acetyltransferase [Gimesia sp.]|uniref:N-acetyltransferase n=1 Tax=Gimesia maris TaxID=122 RepID=A0A3D3R746_9PLAN|nr:GNAT family N-acetyltransferase [Gimesia sp.]HCO23430.1 N-acetyltransferase [Gimesia maris]|tara:strand:- start:2987 stop:3466 length:480 start_codon:yes stop_codon:yes gene_type:complete